MSTKTSIKLHANALTPSQLNGKSDRDTGRTFTRCVRIAKKKWWGIEWSQFSMLTWV